MKLFSDIIPYPNFTENLSTLYTHKKEKFHAPDVPDGMTKTKTLILKWVPMKYPESCTLYTDVYCFGNESARFEDLAPEAK